MNFPSVFDTLGIVLNSDAYVTLYNACVGRHVAEDIHTFPVERVAIESLAREHLTRFPAQFANLIPLDGETELGPMYLACLGDGSACKSFDVRVNDTPYALPVPVLLQQLGEHASLDRHARLGEAATALVRDHVTPHLQMQYLVDAAQRYIVYEVTDLTLRDFLLQKFVYIRDEEKVKVLQTIIMQALHGLLALFVHAGIANVHVDTDTLLMSAIHTSNYCYALDGETFLIPTFGMCWRVVYLYHATSSRLFDTDAVVTDELADCKTFLESLSESVSNDGTLAAFMRETLDIVAEAHTLRETFSLLAHKFKGNLEHGCTVVFTI